jgi:hypothetical protein
VVASAAAAAVLPVGRLFAAAILVAFPVASTSFSNLLLIR